MVDDTLKRILDDTDLYDDAKEDSLRSMLSDFYSKRMRSTAVLVWANGLFFLGLAVATAILFARTDQIKNQIMYAAIFVCFIHWATLTKIFAWQAIHRNSIKRELKRLEIRLVDLRNRLSDESQTG